MRVNCVGTDIGVIMSGFGTDCVGCNTVKSNISVSCDMPYSAFMEYVPLTAHNVLGKITESYLPDFPTFAFSIPTNSLSESLISKSTSSPVTGSAVPTTNIASS